MQLRGMHGIPLTTVKKNNKHVVFEDKVSVEGEEIELNVVKKKYNSRTMKANIPFFYGKR